jgi:hypothetical protein
MHYTKSSCSLLYKSLLFLTLVFLLTSSVDAQVSDHGSVLGTVTDPSGAVVPGVSVTLTNVGTGNVFSTGSSFLP